MEAGTEGAPAAAEQAPQTPQEASMPSMPQVESPTAPAPEAPQESQSEPTLSDVLSRVDSLREEFDSIRQQPAEQPPAPDGNLLDQLLTPEAPEPGAEQFGEPAQPEGGEEGFDPNDPAFQAFESYLDQAIAQRVAPIQEERLEEQFLSLEKRYPDITSETVMPKLSEALDNVVRRSGNDALRADPTMVELAYKAVKAELADAAAVPAEQAATTGASIETGAGRSQEEPPSPADQYVHSVYGGAQKKSVFQ